MKTCFLLLLTALTAVQAATKVNQCKPKTGYIDQDVDVSICKGVPCKLPKKSRVQVSILFTPEEDVKRLRTQVSAELASIPLPFIGVDGTLVCDKIFTPDGNTKAPCPLKAGEKYLYRDHFDVLSIYPKVKVMVHWSLNNADSRTQVACFEIPAEIVN